MDPFDSLPEASIPEGTYKYIQIKCKHLLTGSERLFVRGYPHCEYHMHVLEHFAKTELSKAGELANFQYECPGGGRIKMDSNAQSIQIYGYSQSYGLAKHSLTQEILSRSYPEYEIGWSNEGY